MAVTLMLFVRIHKAHTSARVKLGLKEMANTVKVIVSFLLRSVFSTTWMVTNHLQVTGFA